MRIITCNTSCSNVNHRSQPLVIVIVTSTLFTTFCLHQKCKTQTPPGLKKKNRGWVQGKIDTIWLTSVTIKKKYGESLTQSLCAHVETESKEINSLFRHYIKSGGEKWEVTSSKFNYFPMEDDQNYILFTWWSVVLLPWHW